MQTHTHSYVRTAVLLHAMQHTHTHTHERNLFMCCSSSDVCSDWNHTLGRGNELIIYPANDRQSHSVHCGLTSVLWQNIQHIHTHTLMHPNITHSFKGSLSANQGGHSPQHSRTTHMAYSPTASAYIMAGVLIPPPPTQHRDTAAYPSYEA